MQVRRGALLEALGVAEIGLSPNATIEQSDCFIFRDGQITTFNDEVMVRVKSPIKLNAVVTAATLLALVDKTPDDDLDLTLKGQELLITGKRRRAGIAVTSTVRLPIEDIPAPEKWRRLADGAMESLLQACRTCGSDQSQYWTTMVHVTPDLIEGSDGRRLIRITGPTGFPKPVLLPARSIAKLEGVEISRVSIGKGFTHFRTKSGAEISLRCDHRKWKDDEETAAVLRMKNPRKITLPSNLGEIVSRASIFDAGTFDSRIGVEMADGQLKIMSRKEGGWYRERRSIKYSGDALAFEINPKFLVDLMERTLDVHVEKNKMKVVTGNAEFVVALILPQIEVMKKRKPIKNDTDLPLAESDIPF